MIIQETQDYRLEVKLAYIDSDLIQIGIDRSSTGIEYSRQEYYLKSDELAKLADYINDTLAR